MAFFPIDHYRGSTDPTDRYFGNQLHLFDPWCDVDTLSAESDKVPVSFRWVNRPRRFTRTSSLGDQNQHYKHSGQSEKFHVQLNVADFNPDSIKTHVEGQNVIVEAKQEDRQPNGDFHVRELRKTYELPEHANARHVVSFITPQHILVIEAPIRNPERERELAEVESSEQNLAQFGKHLDPQFDYGAFLGGPFKPHIIDNNGQKQLQLTMPLLDLQPNQIKLSVKNNNLIVQSENKPKDPNHSERSFFFQTVKLPPGTQAKQIQSHLTQDGQLKIEAPFVELKPDSNPIEDQKK